MGWRSKVHTVARDNRQLKQDWLQACDAFLTVTLAHTRYLRANGRLSDPESAKDIAALEEEQAQLRERLERVRAEVRADERKLRLPQDPGSRLSVATRRELRLYRDAVCEDARRLRAHSAALVRRSREAHALRVVRGRGRRTG